MTKIPVRLKAAATTALVCGTLAFGGGPAAAASSRCYMLTYTFGTGFGSVEVRKAGDGPDQELTYAEIIDVIQQNARNGGLGNASVTPTGKFQIACPKAG